MHRLGSLLSAIAVACSSPPTIDGLPPADDPDLLYIEWIGVPASGADRALVQQVLRDSDRSPVAFVGASWCGSCRAYKSTLASQTMKSVHEEVQVVEFDLDHHRALLAEMNIRPSGVPHWEALGEFGISTGQSIDGRAWKEDTEDTMAPVLKAFFAEVTGG